VHLVESSAKLRAIQAGHVPEAVWHDTIEGLPHGPLLLLANEFLDALPIRQFVRRKAGWMERFVRDGRFFEVAASLPFPSRGEARDGEIHEVGEAALDVVSGLAARIAQTGGAALLVDYGPAESAPGDSLQGLRGGRPADPLAVPGGTDLTAHVDFEALAAVARGAGAAVHGPIPQGVCLTRLGLVQRCGALARTLPPVRASAMMESARRLIEPDRMGRLFKVMAVCHPGLPTLPGFADDT